MFSNLRSSHCHERLKKFPFKKFQGTLPKLNVFHAHTINFKSLWTKNAGHQKLIAVHVTWSDITHTIMVQEATVHINLLQPRLLISMETKRNVLLTDESLYLSLSLVQCITNRGTGDRVTASLRLYTLLGC